MTSPPSSMVGDLLREAEAAPHGSTSQAYFLTQAQIAATMLVAHQLAVIAGRLDRITRPEYPADVNRQAYSSQTQLDQAIKESIQRLERQG